MRTFFASAAATVAVLLVSAWSFPTDRPSSSDRPAEVRGVVRAVPLKEPRVVLRLSYP